MSNQVEPPVSDANALRLLVLDDDRARREALLALLQGQGHQAGGHAESAMALAELRQGSCDGLLVVADGGGFEPAAVLARAAQAHPAVAALAWSPALQRPADVAAALAPVQALARLRREHAALAAAGQGAARQLADLGKELDSFAGRISHDLQGVLQVIEGFAAALERTAASKLDDKERRYLQRIGEQSARGNRMVHDLLGFARLAGHPLVSAPVDMAALVAQARRVLAEPPEREVEWSVDALPAVQGDALLLQQVLVHLLGNALKFTRGRAPARIHVGAAAVEGGIEFTVSDNGAGFDAAYADRLFRPFERLHGAGEYEGNGMGLAQVRRIVERHGGSVRAASQAGEGAVFAFTLPAAAATPAVQSASTPTARAEARKLRVLVVDDDPMVLASLRGMLEIDGHSVAAATGGQAGLAAFGEALRSGMPFEVVLTDFGMPIVDGLEVARSVKAACPPTQVVMLTGAATRGGGPAAWKGSVDRVLGKPLRIAQLRETLQGLESH